MTPGTRNPNEEKLLDKRTVLTRREAAEYLARLIGPVSPRTLEALDVPYRAPFGRAIYAPADLEAWAAKRLADAPRRTGCPRKHSSKRGTRT